jgi:hypothetical protein
MKKQKWIVMKLLIALFLVSFVSIGKANQLSEPRLSNAQSTFPDSGKTRAGDREQLAYALGVQAYIYGYPLVVLEQTKEMMLKTLAPINQFYYSQTLASPEYRDIVAPNSNTLYFMAWLDLSKGPVVLHVPKNESGGYYTVQMLDAYTNTFQNISNRTTMGKAGQYAVVGPAWKGNVSVQKINAPTNTVWLIGRVEVGGREDLSRAGTFEKQFTLAPLHGNVQRQQTTLSLPVVQKTGEHPLTFYKIMTEAIKQNPLPPCDHVLLDQFKLVGIDAAKGFDAKELDPATIAGLMRAAKDAQNIIEHAGEGIPTENGWVVGYGIGTYGDKFLLRAIVAYSGLGANVQEEELYARAFVDEKGKPLNGANQYVLHFNKNQIPDVYGFWSITMYGPDFYLVPNPIKRYTIGNLTKGLKYNTDGSLDLYLQQTPPKGREPNWLPAPTGDFNLVLRMFAPKPTMLGGRYKVPPVVGIDQGGAVKNLHPL